jgi:cytochrome c oxidase subunit 4
MTLAEYRKRKGIEPAAGHVTDDAHAEKHPGALEYAQIGVILAVVTAIEVAIYYVGLSHTTLVLALIVLSAFKFTLVVLWFMHLKFDNRLFSSMFLIGLLLAIAIFTVATSTIGGKLV